MVNATGPAEVLSLSVMIESASPEKTGVIVKLRPEGQKKTKKKFVTKEHCCPGNHYNSDVCCGS